MISIPCGSIKSPPPDIVVDIVEAFQFLVVRLKDLLAGAGLQFHKISIPCGSIKRSGTLTRPLNFGISIPCGSIKRNVWN